MIINHKYKFIFIHVAKCGGTSIKRALYPYCDKWDQFLGGHPSVPDDNGEGMHKHSGAMEIKSYATPQRWEEYFTFTFVRNPLSRTLSLYNWWQKIRGVFDPEKKKLICELSFKEFIFSDYTGPSQVELLISKAEKETFVSPKNRIELDLIGKQEDIDKDFAYFCGLNKLPRLTLGVHNKTGHVPITRRNPRYFDKFYDDESRREVKRRYAEDFDTFNYG
jgi:hypothetical protein